jgi:hypothetical protein
MVVRSGSAPIRTDYSGLSHVFETPEDQDGGIPSLFIESATAGDQDVFVEGNRIIGPHDGFHQYHVAVTDSDVSALVFAVKDQYGNVLGQHTLQYFLEGYSYYCSPIQGI